MIGERSRINKFVSTCRIIEDLLTAGPGKKKSDPGKLKLVRRVSEDENSSGDGGREMGAKLSWHCPQKIAHTIVSFFDSSGFSIGGVGS